MRHWFIRMIALVCIAAIAAGCVSFAAAEENRTAYNPVRLSSLRAYAKGKFDLTWDYMKYDTRSGLYADMLFGSMDVKDGSAYLLYDLGGKYHYLRATAGAKRNGNGINEKYKAIIRIYGDERLLFSDEEITSVSQPYEMTVDVSGVMDLKIEMYGAGNSGSNGIRAMLGNPVLLEDDPDFFLGAPDAPSAESYASAADLSAFSAYRKGRFDLAEDYNIQDSRGNQYDFALRGYMMQKDGTAYQVYDIGGNYQFFTATVAPALMRNTPQDGYTGLIRIYGDDRLLWSDERVNSLTRPYDITVYIGHVQDLKIEIYGNNGGSSDGVNPMLGSPKLLP